MGTALGERDRGLDRRVPTADHQRFLPGEVLGVVETVVHLVETFAGRPQLSKITAPPDRDQDAARPEGPASGEMDQDRGPLALHSLRAGRHGSDPRARGLILQLLDKLLLHVRAHLEVAGRFHRSGVGVDGLRLREVHDGRKGFRCFEDLEREALFLRLYGSGHAGDARSDDDEVERVLALGLRAKPGIRGDRAHDPRPGIE